MKIIGHDKQGGDKKCKKKNLWGHKKGKSTKFNKHIKIVQHIRAKTLHVITG